MSKKIIYFLIVSTVIMSVFIGCGKSDTDQKSTTATKSETTETAVATETVGEPVDLSMVYWHPEQKDIMEQLNAKFTEENSNITIELQQVPGDQYEKVLRTRFLAGDGPDVYLMFGVNVFMYGKDGFFGDLTNEPFASNVLDGYRGSCTYEGKLYGIPMNANVTATFYNKTVFEKAGITELPKTYAEFLAICEEIKAIGVTPIARGAKDAWTGLHEISPLSANIVLGKNENFQSDRYNDRIKFATSPEMKDFFTAYIELVDKGYIEKGVLGMNHSQAAQQVADGTAAMMLGISAFYGDIMAANAEADIGYFAFPDENGNVFVQGASDKAIGYWPEGDKIADSIKVVGFYARPDVDSLYCNNTQTLPCIKGAKVDLAQPLVELVADIEKQKIVFNWFDQWPAAAYDVERLAIQGIHAGKTDIDAILAEMDKAYDDNKSNFPEPMVK